MKTNFLKKIYDLETVEEKSFWVIAPMTTFFGICSLATSNFYSSAIPTLISSILCLIIPVVLMFHVYNHHNYHYAYPMLCILIGGVSIPLTFVFSGGFLSGMPLFCSISTGISALCYSKKWRNISLASCLFGNAVAFYYVYFYGSPFSFETTQTIYNDIIFGYLCSAIGAFGAINLIITEVRKYRVSQGVLEQYFDTAVSKEILDKALKDGVSAGTGKQKAVILFVDISNFTTITEKMPSEDVAKFLNLFFNVALKHIHDTKGIIDKFIGDCVMAYWFDMEGENAVYNAINSLLNMREDLYNQSEKIFNELGIELNFSAGLSFGDIIFGDIGADAMHDYTVIGDAVNTASRLEELAVSGEILISDGAAERVKDLITLEHVDSSLYLKGKNQPVNIYRVIGYSDSEDNTEISIDQPYGYSLYICGCRGSFPVSGIRFSEYGGETSCYVLKKGDYAIVVDCGTGLKNAIDIISDCKKVDILITHVHYDHILGLLMSRPPKSVEFRMFGHFDNWDANTEVLTEFTERPYWPVKLTPSENINVSHGEEIKLYEDITATFYPSDHPDGASVIKLMVKDRKICFFADCEDATKLDSAIAYNADLLFYDGMFDDNDTVDHTGWGHGTWQAGLRYAEAEKVKRLIVTHHNPEIGDLTLNLREKQARELMNNVSFAKAGNRITI